MKIVCIGDSLTEGLGVVKEKSWPLVLGELGKIEVVNRGISGDTTTGMVGRFYHDVIHHQPSHCIIMGGANDLWWDQPIHGIMANLYSMIKQALHHKITPIIGIPTPICMEAVDRETVWEPVAGYPVLQDKLGQLVSGYRRLAEGNGWPYIDFHSLYLNENKEVNQLYFANTDGIHPNETGHRDMAQLALETIKMVLKK